MQYIDIVNERLYIYIYVLINIHCHGRQVFHQKTEFRISPCDS